MGFFVVILVLRFIGKLRFPANNNNNHDHSNNNFELKSVLTIWCLNINILLQPHLRHFAREPVNREGMVLYFRLGVN